MTVLLIFLVTISNKSLGTNLTNSEIKSFPKKALRLHQLLHSLFFVYNTQISIFTVLAHLLSPIVQGCRTPEEGSRIALAVPRPELGLHKTQCLHQLQTDTMLVAADQNK